MMISLKYAKMFSICRIDEHQDSVRNGRNKREGSGDEAGVSGGGGHTHQGQSQNRPYGSQEGYGSSGQYGQQQEPQGHQSGAGGYGYGGEQQQSHEGGGM